jgi:uncharacterized protein HemX
MVVQQAVNNLKGKPQDERTAVAGGAASLVVAILFIGWIIYFLHKINSGAQQMSLDGIQNQINLPAVQQANKDIQAQFENTAEEYQRIRDAAAAQQAGGSQQQVMQIEMTGDTNQFNGGTMR